MPIKIILAVAFVIGLTACEKTNLADTTTSSSKEGGQKEKIATQPIANELSHQNHEPAPLQTNEVNKTGKGVIHDGESSAIKSAPAAPVSTEQALGQTISHAQKITRSQKSETRQRGQSVEEEMLMELEKQKN